MTQRYFGCYETFDTTGKDQGGALLSADNLVGDEFTVQMEMTEEGHTAWLVNRFGKRVGFFSPSFSRKLGILQAEGLTIKAVLSFVAFSTEPEPGHYWGEAAVIAYAPAYATEFERFIAQVGARMADSVRTNVAFDNTAVDRIIDSGGEWMPSQTVPLPKKSKGMMVMKDKRSFTDKLVEQGRARNKGCYVASWLFIIAIVALIVWGICSLFFTSGA